MAASIRFLPACSPDLKLIQMVFSKPEAYLRKMTASSFDRLTLATRIAMDSFTPDQCSNFFTKAYYIAY